MIRKSSLAVIALIDVLTVAAVVARTAHGVPDASLPALPARQTGASGSVAELLVAAFLVSRAT